MNSFKLLQIVQRYFQAIGNKQQYCLFSLNFRIEKKKLDGKSLRLIITTEILLSSY